MTKFFFAYASEPQIVGQTIVRAATILNKTDDRVLTWEAMEIAGRFIPDAITGEIDSRVLAADITVLNFNVIYEIGYAIGKGRKILLFKNDSIEEQIPTLLQFGILDTIGITAYVSSDDLAEFLRRDKPRNLSTAGVTINRQMPVFILQSKYKDDFALRITARAKKNKIAFRTFDPSETPRMSAGEAISSVAQSNGVILSLLPANVREYKIHNLRSAFVAGLATGMGKRLLILQQGNDATPMDLRDTVIRCPRIENIDGPMSDFASDMWEFSQQADVPVYANAANTLEKLDFGASSAENEMKTLHSYYLKTEGFLKASRGEVQLVVGRKGSGKTAVFLQIRDTERKKVDNVVLDLMPDGYQLIKFKEQVLNFLSDGSMQHTITAFWEYVLTLEIIHKILEQDKSRYWSNKEWTSAYKELESLRDNEQYVNEGDFSERMTGLMDRIGIAFKQKYENKVNVSLIAEEVTGMLYKGNIKHLQAALIQYLKFKKEIWLLFDNVDKGWPSTGLKNEDAIIIRALIDAAAKMKRYYDRYNLTVNPIIFLRNDVYDLVVKGSPDRQKESKVLLDWTDPDMLRTVVKLRIEATPEIPQHLNFQSLWNMICTTQYNGEDSFKYLVDRCLMRPRFLINLIKHCRSFAVNLNQSKIREEDISKGLYAYSSDLVQDITYEIQDIFPDAVDVLRPFISGKRTMDDTYLIERLSTRLKANQDIIKVTELLLWYGFIGVQRADDIKYIYSVNYDIETLKAIRDTSVGEAQYTINPAFWPALLIDETL